VEGAFLFETESTLTQYAEKGKVKVARVEKEVTINAPIEEFFK